MIEITEEDLMSDRTVDESLATARAEIMPLLYDIMRLRLKSLCGSPWDRAPLEMQVGKKTARLDSLVILTMPDGGVPEDRAVEDRGAVLLSFRALERAIEDSPPEYRLKAWTLLENEARAQASRLAGSGSGT